MQHGSGYYRAGQHAEHGIRGEQGKEWTSFWRPAAFCRPSDIMFMPNRNTASPPSRPNTVSIGAFTRDSPSHHRLQASMHAKRKDTGRTVRPLSRECKVQVKFLQLGGRRGGRRAARGMAQRARGAPTAGRVGGGAAAGDMLGARFLPQCCARAHAEARPTATDIRDQAKRTVILRSASRFAPRAQHWGQKLCARRGVTLPPHSTPYPFARTAREASGPFGGSERALRRKRRRARIRRRGTLPFF